MTASPSIGAALLALLMFLILDHAVAFQPTYSNGWHLPWQPNHFSHSAYSVHHHGGHHFPSAASSTALQAGTSSTPTPLDPNAMNCQLVLPSDALTAGGLATPWKLLPPCSQAVTSQQAFAEAAIIDAEGQISIYHPLIIDQGKSPQVAPVTLNLGAGSQVALFFGFNGGVLTLVDSNGQGTDTSAVIKGLQCVNGLPGVQGDVFGQVSWCNTEPFWNAANAAVANGQLQVPQLGNDDLGKQCPSTRSFEIVDQDQSDNLPTKYLLLSDGSTVQFTAANQAKFPSATQIDNASDEALIATFIDPAIGCTPYQVDSIDDPGTKVSALSTQELQALLYQQNPIALIPLNNPDTLLTASGSQSPAKTNTYRIGVNQPQLGMGSNSNDGSPTDYCNNLVNLQPPFLASFQNRFTNVMTPDAGTGNNLFTFLSNRFLMSLTNLGCTNQNIPVQCQQDGNGAATACTIATTSSTVGHSSQTAFPSYSSRPHRFGNYSMPAGIWRAHKTSQAFPSENRPSATPWFA